MKFWPIFKVAARALLKNKVRSFLTTLGIIMGIASVIAMMAIGQGATAMVQNEIKGMGNNLIIVFPGSMHGGPRGGSGSKRTLTYDDAHAIAAQSAYVLAVSPINGRRAQAIYGDSNWQTSVQGVGLDYPTVRSWNTALGDFFTDSDYRAGLRVCVIGQTTRKELFGAADPIGKTIRINNMPFQVAGVMEPKGTAAFGMDQDDTVLVPFTTFRRVLARSSLDDVDQVLVSLHTMDDLTDAKRDIGALLRERHRLAPEAEDDFSLMDQTEVANTISSVSRIMTVLLTVIASISLAVGGIGIMNIMLVSVTERIREIGLRKAVGARNRDILFQFLGEAVALSMVGGLIGVSLGVVAAKVLAGAMSWPVSIAPSYVIMALSFSAGVGVFFGFYPAFRAARLNPIEALKYE